MVPNLDEMMKAGKLARVRAYRELNAHAVKGLVVLAGSSLMEGFPINELLMSRGNTKIVYNRGIAGAVLSEYIKHVQTCILDLEPAKLFINIGSNDLDLPGDTIGNLISKYRTLLEMVMSALPDCKITLLAYYPRSSKEPIAPPMMAGLNGHRKI